MFVTLFYCEELFKTITEYQKLSQRITKHIVYLACVPLILTRGKLLEKNHFISQNHNITYFYVHFGIASLLPTMTNGSIAIKEKHLLARNPFYVKKCP